MHKQEGISWSKANKSNKRDVFRVNKEKTFDKNIEEKKAYEFLCREYEAKTWIEEMINEKLPEGTANFIDNIRDGVILCKLANVFAPGVVKKIHTVKTGSVLEFMATDNLNQFFNACLSLNFPKNYLFPVVDLWEKKNILRVIHCLHALAHFLSREGKWVKIKDLSKAGIVFDEHEIQATKEALQKIEEEDANSHQSQLTFLMTADQEEPPSESSDETEIAEDLADPDECTVVGEGAKSAKAGVEAKFLIEARDTLGNAIQVGGEEFSVVLFYGEGNKEKLLANVKDLENGTYEVTYTPEKSGEYSMEIYLHDLPEEDVDEGENEEEFEPLLLKICPIKVQVHPADESDPTKCVIGGLGATSAVAGTASKFTVESYDRFGNAGAGGEKFVATLTKEGGDEVIELEGADNGDGTYSFEYTCPHSGVYNLEVKLKDATVGVSKIIVKDAGVSDPKICVVQGIQNTLKAGEKTSLTILAKDKLGNQRESGGEQFTVTIVHTSSEEEIKVDLVDTNDGQYHGEYVLTKHGKYNVNVQLGDVHVTGSPFEIKVVDTGVSDPKQCIAKEEIKTLEAGTTKTIVVEARDEYGNPRATGGEVFTGRIVSKSKLEEIPEDRFSHKDLGNGTYEIEFTLQEAGEYALEVLFNKQDSIQGFPYDITVLPTATEPKNAKVEGEGLKNAVTNQPAQFTIVTYDKFGNQRTVGGDSVQVTLVNIKKETQLVAEVTDLEDGSYEVNYLPTSVGEYQVQVTINGEKVEPTFTLHVAPPHVKELSESELFSLHDHDILNSLVNEFNNEESDSLLGEIEELRNKVIEQIRTNTQVEKGIREIEKKIELLINHRVNVEEVLKSSKGLFNIIRRQRPKQKEKQVKQENMNVEAYSNLFYLLQTEPRYLSKALFNVPSHILDKFLDTVILTLYGYAFSEREEYLILNLFKQTLELEVSKDTKKVGGFLDHNPVLPKMVVVYGRRTQGKQYLQKVLYDKIVDPILSTKDLDLDLNAVKLYREYLSNQEVESGVKSTIDKKSITYEQAMADEATRKEIEARKAKLCEILNNTLMTLTDNVNELPYGLRYVAKQLDIALKNQHPDSTPTDRASVAGNFIYYRFMNPALVSPDGFELTKKKISPKMRNNLLLISKVMTNLTNHAFFDKKLDEHLCIMNDWLKESEKPYVDFIQKVAQINDPEDSLGVDEYAELTQKQAPTITITWNEIYSTHALLLQYINKIAPDPEDNLRKILAELGDKAPQELPQDQNEEIRLALINKFADTEKKQETTIDQIYDQTKEAFRKILKVIPPEGLGDDVVSTLKKTRGIATKLISGNEDENATKLLQRVNLIEENLPILEQKGKVSSSDNYRALLLDITKELQNMKEIRKKQKKQFERLKETLISLQEHNKYLKEKFNDFEEYIKDCQRKQFAPTTKSKRMKNKALKKFKFTYNQLKNKGVIKQLNVMKSQKNKVFFYISMPEPGLFAVDAKIAGLTVKTIHIKLEDLLSKQADGQDEISYEYVTLDVNMTLHTVNKLFMAK